MTLNAPRATTAPSIPKDVVRVQRYWLLDAQTIAVRLVNEGTQALYLSGPGVLLVMDANNVPLDRIPFSTPNGLMLTPGDGVTATAGIGHVRVGGCRVFALFRSRVPN